MTFKMKGYSAFDKDVDPNYKVPSNEEIVRLQEDASEKAGERRRYDANASKRAGKHIFHPAS